jgi:hypothetical protein
MFSSCSRAKRLEGDGEAVELEVDEVALGVAGLAAGGDVGAAGLLDGDGDCGRKRVLVDVIDWIVGWEKRRNVRMGMLKQLAPMRSSPLLQQASFWPLPQTASEAMVLPVTLVLPSEAPWGEAKATAATEAMRRVLKKAILVDWVGLVKRVEEANVIVVLK